MEAQRRKQTQYNILYRRCLILASNDSVLEAYPYAVNPTQSIEIGENDGNIVIGYLTDRPSSDYLSPTPTLSPGAVSDALPDL